MALPDLLQGLPLSDLDSYAVAAACEQARLFCDWHIAPSVTETVTVAVRDGVGLLPSLRVTAVTSVNGATAGYSWFPDGRVVLEASRWHGAAVVVFTHGYDICPAPVRAAVAQMAARGLVPEPQRRSQTAGPFAETYFEQPDPLVGLHAYRRPVVA